MTISTDLQSELQPFSKNGELLDLLKIAETLRNTPQINRSHAAKRANWMRVEATMESTRWRMPFALKLTLAPLASLLVILPSLTFLSQSALPGDVLYGVKRASENAQFAVVPSAGQKARLCSTQMKKRANELAQLTSGKATVATTQALTESIMSEANEFKDYVAKTSGDHSQLEELRRRDASYVIDALNTARTKATDVNSSELIQNTIQQMQQIVNKA